MDLPLDFGARHLVLVVVAVTVGAYWIATGKVVEGAAIIGVLVVGIAIQVVLHYAYETE